MTTHARRDLQAPRQVVTAGVVIDALIALGLHKRWLQLRLWLLIIGVCNDNRLKTARCLNELGKLPASMGKQRLRILMRVIGRTWALVLVTCICV